MREREVRKRKAKVLLSHLRTDPRKVQRLVKQLQPTMEQLKLRKKRRRKRRRRRKRERKKTWLRLRLSNQVDREYPDC